MKGNGDDGGHAGGVIAALAAHGGGDGEEVFRTLKDDINRFLWTRLPESMTLGKAEELACEIHDRIMAAWGQDL